VPHFFHYWRGRLSFFHFGPTLGIAPPFKTGTHEKWHVVACFKKKGVDALLNGFP
jgi:hypothetical protein